MRSAGAAQRESVRKEWITTFRILRPIPYRAAYRFIAPYWIPRTMACYAERNRMDEYHSSIAIVGSAKVFVKKNTTGTHNYDVHLHTEYNARNLAPRETVYWLYLLYVSFLRLNDRPIRTQDSVTFIRETIGFCGNCMFCKSIYRTVVNRSTYRFSPRLANQMRRMPYIEHDHCEVKFPPPELIPIDLSIDISDLP